MPQYDYVMATRRLGQVARDINWTIDSYTNGLSAQVNTTTIAATPTDGTYTIRIEDPAGDIDISAVASSDTADDVALALRTAAGTGAVADALLNVAVVSGATDEVIVTFLHRTGQNTVVSYPSNPGGDASGVNTVSAVGTVLPLGVAVAPGADDDTCILPSGAVTILGITALNPRANLNTGDSTQVDGTVPGQVASVFRQGVITVQATQAVTAGAAVYARNAAATVALPLGSLSDSATSSVVIPGARWRTSTTAAGLADVTINNP